ncbi:MAG: CAAX prenyl protease-related protein [bacterium]
MSSSNRPGSDNSMNTDTSDLRQHANLWHYVVPFLAFLAITSLEGEALNDDGTLNANLYAIIYCIKIAVVVGCVAWGRRALADLRPMPDLQICIMAIVSGLLVGFFWVHLEGFYPPLPESVVGKRTGFNPLKSLDGPLQAIFLAIRFLGLVIVVPVIEELFTRDFVLRFVTKPEWETVQPWQFSRNAALFSTIIFVVGHPEWLPAILCGVIWLAFLRYSKSVSALVISHAVANLAIGVYSLVTGDWHFL